MTKSIRVIIGIILVALIIGVSIYAYINREVIFSNRVTIEYPDQCVEIYVNNEMISPECTAGRELAEANTPKNITPMATPYGVVPWQE